MSMIIYTEDQDHDEIIDRVHEFYGDLVSQISTEEDSITVEFWDGVKLIVSLTNPESNVSRLLTELCAVTGGLDATKPASKGMVHVLAERGRSVQVAKIIVDGFWSKREKERDLDEE